MEFTDERQALLNTKGLDQSKFPNSSRISGAEEGKPRQEVKCKAACFLHEPRRTCLQEEEIIPWVKCHGRVREVGNCFPH